MRYLIALIIPPLAVLLCGKPGQAVLNFFLCLLFLVPGVIHAAARGQQLLQRQADGQDCAGDGEVMAESTASTVMLRRAAGLWSERGTTAGRHRANARGKAE